MNGKKRSLRSPSARGGGRKRALGGSPPEFVPTISTGHVFRFSAGQAFTSQPVTRGMLLNLYSVAATTTQQYRLLTAIKIKRVRLWGQPVALGSQNSRVACEWVGYNAPSTIHSDTATGVRPSFVDSVPPKDSSNAWWSISGVNDSETLFNVTGPTGTVIDVHLSVRFADNEVSAPAENGTAAAASVGRVYWNYLDGFSSKKLAPEGGVTVLP